MVRSLRLTAEDKQSVLFGTSSQLEDQNTENKDWRLAQGGLCLFECDCVLNYLHLTYCELWQRLWSNKYYCGGYLFQSVVFELDEMSSRLSFDGVISTLFAECGGIVDYIVVSKRHYAESPKTPTWFFLSGVVQIYSEHRWNSCICESLYAESIYRKNPISKFRFVKESYGSTLNHKSSFMFYFIDCT